MKDTRMVKAATLGWIQNYCKVLGKKNKPMLYWKKIILNYTRIESLTQDRKEWKERNKIRIYHLEKWEEKRANQFNVMERGERNSTSPPPSRV